MSKINSKKKGSKNERDLAHAFEEWTGYKFARVPMSGGLRWQRTLDTTGDLIVADTEHIHEFPFSVETKFHNEVNFWKILRGQKSPLLEFWKQATQDADRGKKVPIVFFRFNGLPKQFWYVIVSYKLYLRIKAKIFFENGFVNYDNEIVIFPSLYLFESDYQELLPILKKHQKVLYL
jgi:Holliday junction resolvase